ncbi:acyltransferase family protein [Psychrosphaera sp. F3M07]|uniref:acyltransferase family protein n=1 Tax=Psychrosphaera sp. F3M07 TaxID=2841560 RepID=UPI001C0A3B61|nr:acyltransferase family protein [Psychrosphaera sp. F3M07]MBU2918702.1 acyltransferase family protein [Psychrosphaera sp. F3M07]
MTSQIQTNQRLYYLDGVRAFALILGVFFHASLSFMPMFIGWAVMDISTSEVVSIFVLISHSFRMELFFLIAGYFSHLKFHQQSLSTFLKSRFVRILIPFVLGWFLLRPLLVSGWILGGESMRGEANIINGLIAGFDSLSELPKGLLIGTHLWFLYYLLFISISLILLRVVIGQHQPTYHWLKVVLDRGVSWVSNARTGILWVSVPTSLCLWFMNSWGMETPDKSLIPNIPVTLIYAGFFFFGWLLHRHDNLIGLFSKITPSKLIFFLVSTLSCVILAGFEMKYGHVNYQYIKAGFLFSYAVMMWTLIALSIGFANKLIKGSNKVVRYLADASYWLYLIHLPIVIWLQIAFAELPLHWSLKLVTVSGMTILLSILLYDIFVRSTLIGAVLNGSRKTRVIFNKHKNQ